VLGRRRHYARIPVGRPHDVIEQAAARPPRAAGDVVEWMDDPACPEDLMRPNLGALGRINRLTGAVRLILAYLDRLVPLWEVSRAAGAPLRLLDVATGGADIPRAIAAWAAGRGIAVQIVAVDRHPTTARLAADASARFPEITVIRADARALPFVDRGFDACFCSLALHHFEAADRLPLLRRLDRLARFGFLVVDLVRSPTAHAGIWLLTRCFRNPVTRADGPRSVAHAYTWPEYQALRAGAGIPALTVRRVWGFRAALERLG
jgi:SAM-dependent methyltransferase